MIWLNLWRTPVRTGLTVFGAALALSLYCLLEAVLGSFQAGVDLASVSRLIVQHKESLTFYLPRSQQSQIAQIPGVTGVAGGTWVGGVYEVPLDGGSKRDDFFANFAVDLEDYLPLYPEMRIPPDQWAALLSDRSGCVIGDQLAQRLSKRIGDQIRLRGTIFPSPEPWVFTIRAIYTAEGQTFDRTMMLYGHNYVDEYSEAVKGQVGFYAVRIGDPDRYAEICAAIDERFANSASETRTLNEKVFNMQFLSMLGNLQLLFRFIGTIVLLTMLLITANTMIMSGRERTRDMAILKALGFSDEHIFTVLIGESLAVVFLGAVLGAGGIYLLINGLGWNPKPDFFPVFQVPIPSLLAAVAIALLTGLLSGLVPACEGLRLKAAQALRAV